MHAIAYTIEIPDWIIDSLFCGPFWLGFLVGAGVVIALLLYSMRNFSPFG